jgi:hypothetical protein
VNAIARIVNKHLGEIAGFHDLLTRKSGGERFIHLTLTLPHTVTVSQAHDLCDRIETEICGRLQRCHILIHCEPCDFGSTCSPECPAWEAHPDLQAKGRPHQHGKDEPPHVREEHSRADHIGGNQAGG